MELAMLYGALTRQVTIILQAYYMSGHVNVYRLCLHLAFIDGASCSQQLRCKWRSVVQQCQ